ncbi:MAG: tyrosine-type recombinase/integrase [Eubacteriales bacterium]|nr:tyrosine-type recombinase/integrase [Eubacteriales bacterium]
MTRTAYHTQSSRQAMEKLRQLQLELPSVCTDYFRAIAQSTSALTRQAYAYDLRLFFRYLCAEESDFADTEPRLMTKDHLTRVNARHIGGFQDYLQMYVKNGVDEEHTQAVITNQALGIMRKLSSLRSFFDYLFKNELIPANVAALVAMPKRHQKPILYMEKEEVERMLQAMMSGKGLNDRERKFLDINRKRDIAIVMMFLGTGIRVSELVGLDIDHVDFRNNSFLVTRKGGDQTILYFSEMVAEYLQDYLQQRLESQPLEGHEHALFLSLQRRRISQRAVEKMVKKYAVLGAPLKPRLSPHKLRSTFGTNLYRATGDIYLVADTLGHADVNTTRRHYAAMSDDKRREAAKRIELPNIQENTEEMPEQ